MIFLFIYLISVVVCFGVLFLNNRAEPDVREHIELKVAIAVSIIPIVNFIFMIIGVCLIFANLYNHEFNNNETYRKINNWFMNGGK